MSKWFLFDTANPDTVLFTADTPEEINEYIEDRADEGAVGNFMVCPGNVSLQTRQALAAAQVGATELLALVGLEPQQAEPLFAEFAKCFMRAMHKVVPDLQCVPQDRRH